MPATAAGRAWARLLDLCGILAGLAVATMAIMVTINVAGRNLGYGNIRWLLETTEYALYISTFLAAPWVLHLGAHVRVDLLVSSVPQGIARALDAVTDLLGIVISLFLLRHGILVAVDAYGLNAITVKELAVPEWMLVAVIPLSSLMLCIEFTLRLFRVGRDDGGGRGPASQVTPGDL